MTLNDVKNKRIELETKLSDYLKNPTMNEKKITATRGKLLKAYLDEYNLETNFSERKKIHELLKKEAKNHKSQVNERIKKVKNDKDITATNQISKELGLKFKKIKTDVNILKASNTITELSTNMLKTAGNTASLAASAAKAPVVAALNLSSMGIKYAAKIVAQPLHIPAYLFSKIKNPDYEYEGKKVNNMGKFVGEKLSVLLKDMEKGVRKI